MVFEGPRGDGGWGGDLVSGRCRGSKRLMRYGSLGKGVIKERVGWSLIWYNGVIREGELVKNDMEGDDDFASGKIDKMVIMVIRLVFVKDTMSGSRG